MSQPEQTNQVIAGDLLKDRVMKGRNVSGRSWKLRPQKRASSLVTKTVQNNRSRSWEAKMKEKEAKRLILERENNMKDEKRQAAIEKKERRIENERRRQENEFRVASRSAQTLGKNADLKLKAMNKKQLRQIKKTRINVKTGAVEFVGAYSK
jgi:hypothetical protein